MTGILFVLKTGIPWVELPAELGLGSGMTCLRRIRDWQLAGVWDEIRGILTDKLPYGPRIDWSRVSQDVEGVRQPSPNEAIPEASAVGCGEGTSHGRTVGN